jgi:hypothetical protein
MPLSEPFKTQKNSLNQDMNRSPIYQLREGLKVGFTELNLLFVTLILSAMEILKRYRFLHPCKLELGVKCQTLKTANAVLFFLFFLGKLH